MILFVYLLLPLLTKHRSLITASAVDQLSHIHERRFHTPQCTPSRTNKLSTSYLVHLGHVNIILVLNPFLLLLHLENRFLLQSLFGAISIIETSSIAMDVPAVKPSSLAFITALDPNGWQKPSNRTLVKKHAMKDVGLGRRRPKKNRTFELVLDPRSQLGPGNVDPFAPFPIEMGPLERKLVANIFRDDIDGTQRPYRSSWFSLGFHDVATFYMLLSNSAAHLDTLRGGTSRGLDAERFHMMALQSVSRRLSEPNFEASDGLIGTIAGLITHNVRFLVLKSTSFLIGVKDIVGNSDQWTLHFNAVDKLVHLRGGIRSINRILRESVCW